MIRPEWRSAPGFVAAVRFTLDSSSLPRPSSLLLDSTVCPLGSSSSCPPGSLCCISSVDSPDPPLPRRLPSIRVPSRPTLEATIFGPSAFVLNALAPLSIFLVIPSRVVGPGPKHAAYSLSEESSTWLTEAYPSTFDSRRPCFAHLVPKLLRSGSNLHLCFPTESSLAR